MRPSPSYTSISTPTGASSAAARARAVLYDPARRLPEIARIFTLGRPDRREARLEDDLVRQEESPAGERRVPVQPELRAVDGARELDADSVVSIRVGTCSHELALQLDGPRDVLDRQCTYDDELVAPGLDGGRFEAELRIP